MCRNSLAFVEWKEHFVSQERGSRLVHYILKDSSGESILAVVGTERSLRHMVYVVADEFVKAYGEESSVASGFKWRSRREVVDWLTSMLCKQQLHELTKCDSNKVIGSSAMPFSGLSAQQINASDKTGDQENKFKQPCSDILWLGNAWACGKQLKHYPAFCRNGTTIAIQSFVFVMAKEGNEYVAYLEDMYEDKRGQKKVKVRWFHHSQEVKSVINLRNTCPKEVFITPNTQVISAECVDGPAIVLSREHFEKCMAGYPQSLPPKIHLCFRQFRNNKIKPFDLSKLRGYFDQPILSCLEAYTFLKPNCICYGLTRGEVKAFNADENVVRGTKRTRNFGEQQGFLKVHSGAGQHWKKIAYEPLCRDIKYNLSSRRLFTLKNVEFNKCWDGRVLKVDEKIELLSQDSGIRGCWFRCTVLEISRKQVKVQYDDLEDQDGCGNLEEWVPAFRLAAPDKLSVRCPGRPTIRPCPPNTNVADSSYEVGAPVDAWWSDGWWEGIIAGVSNGVNDSMQVYIPGENLFLNVLRKNLRVSRDWTGSQWIDIIPKPDILSVMDDESADFDKPNDEIPQKGNVNGIQNKEDNLVVLPCLEDHPENMNKILVKNDCDDDDNMNKILVKNDCDDDDQDYGDHADDHGENENGDGKTNDVQDEHDQGESGRTMNEAIDLMEVAM
ncbi:hypothetical protein Nepgr_026879 [Nepenthes gracilis]|uniref:BAH domain-containing protein n=1 Tax=Nepenthes gracilis TaxID=150966 RepID=A0AAD3Y2Y9_NEPGR|nr:hypothetical protein Nepgr_026879 [Nepenthes gracilis]